MEDERGSSAVAVLMAFIGGAALGAAAALLLAPRSGHESREILRGYAKRAEDTLRDFVGEAGETWDEVVEQGRDFVASKKSAIRESVEAGHEAMQRESDPSGGRQG